MTKPLLKASDKRLGPHSRLLDRGALGDRISATSREGRYLTKITSNLMAQIGTPTFAQELLIRRVAKTMLRLELLDERLAGGTGSDHDERAYNALSNSVRLGLRELNLKSANPVSSAPSLAEIAARYRKDGEAP